MFLIGATILLFPLHRLKLRLLLLTLLSSHLLYPEVVQYHNYWCWRHPCHAQGAKCQKCGGPHRVENHRSMAWYYKANPKSNSPREATTDGTSCPHTFKCINCKSEHSADDTKCPFWHCHFDRQWDSNKATELCTSHASNSNVQCSRAGNL